MDWPSMSPDLNPIEHLWGILKQKVEERKVSNIHQLCDVVMEEWKRTPVATCEALVNSMSKRAKAALEIMVATQNIDTLGPIWTFSFHFFWLGCTRFCGLRFRHEWLCIELF